MSDVVIVTPTHAPDFASFARLHASVEAYAEPGIRHVAIVPTADLPLFRSLGGERLELITQREVLPRSFVETTRLGRLAASVPGLPRGARVAGVNLRRPWPPLRGWVLQQVIKFAIAERIEERAAVFIDSDVELIRPFAASAFVAADGVVRRYRAPGAVNDGMPRHLAWHRVARRLIGAPPPDGPRDDFVAGIVSWDTDLVRALLARVAETGGRPWPTSIGSEPDVSEFILYGEYVTAFGGDRARSFDSPDSLCHSYWDPKPMSAAEAVRFVERLPASALAIHIQSNSSTSDETLRLVRDGLSLRI